MKRSLDEGRTPRWVKAAAVIALILVVAIVVLLVTGTHGPGRHSQSTGVRGYVR